MHNSRDGHNSYFKIILDCYFDVFGILCQMPLISKLILIYIMLISILFTIGLMMPKFIFSDASSLRSIYIWLDVLAYAIFIFYAGILTSYLAVFIPSLPFDTMQEFLNDGHYKLAIIKNTSSLELLRVRTDFLQFF